MTLQKVSGTYSLPYTIKAEWTAYLVFSIMFLPLSGLMVFANFKHPSPNAWQAILVPLLALTVFLIWIGNFKIVIKEDRIFYNTLLSRGNEILFSNIIRIEISIGRTPDGEASKKSAWVRLNIYDKTRKEPLTINMKPFSKRDLIIIVDCLTTKNPQIELDELARDLKEGNFEPIVSATIKQIWQVGLIVFWIFLAFALIHALRLSMRR